MASRVIDAVLRLTDNFTNPAQKAITSMTSMSKAGIKCGKDIQKAGDQIAKVGAGLTAAVTVPLAGLAAASYKNFESVDKQLALVRATMGETAYATADLSDELAAAMTKSIFTMDEGAAALVNYARQGWNAKQAADMLTPALNLAAGTATDLDSVTSGLGNTLKAFGASSDEATHYADMFTQAQAQANTNVQGLFDAMSVAGPIAKTVGWDFEDIATLVGVFGDMSIDATEGANALKTGLARLSGGNSTANKALDALHISLFDDTGQMKSMVDVIDTLQGAFDGLTEQEQMYYASQLFGANQMSKWLALINGPAASALGDMRDNITNASGNAQEAADALMTPLEQLASTFDVFKYSVGNAIAGAVVPFITKATELIDKFRQMTPEQQQQVVRWAAIAAAAGPALLVFGKVVSAVGKGVMLFNKFGMAVKAAGGIMGVIVSPVGIVIGIILALIAVVAIVATHFDTFKRSLGAVSPVFASIQARVQSLIAKFQEIWTVVGPIVTQVGSLFANVFTAYIGGCVAFVASQIDTMLMVFQNIMLVLQGVIDFVVGVFTGNWQLAWDGIGQIVTGVCDGILGFFKGMINGLISAINGFLGGLNGLSIPDWVPLAGGKTFSIPLIPTLGVGTDNWAGGIAQVHERGGEIIDLPRGSRVYPHDESLAMARAEGAASSSQSITIAKLADQIIVREQADIDRIGDAIVRKLKKANDNRGGWTFDGVMA